MIGEDVNMTVVFPFAVTDETDLVEFMRGTFQDVVLRLDLSTRLLGHRIDQLRQMKKRAIEVFDHAKGTKGSKRLRAVVHAGDALPAAVVAEPAPDLMAADADSTQFGGPSFGAASGYYWWHATRQYLEAQRMVLACVLTAARANAIVRLARSAGFGAQEARPRVARKRAFV
jgi:hypothetical protein